MYPSIPRKSARISRMNFSSSTMSTRGRSYGAEVDIGADPPNPNRFGGVHPAVRSFWVTASSERRGLHESAPRESFREIMVAARHGRQDQRLEPLRRVARPLTDGRAPSLVVATSLAIAAAACGVSVALGSNPLFCRGWLGARGAASWLLSLGLGLLVGTVTVGATPALVRRWRWARALHAALRPVVNGAGDGTLLAVALAGAAGEELFFRGLLVPLVGVTASSIA